MIHKFIFVWCLSYLCSGAHIEHSSQYSQELSGNTQCIFYVPRKIYSITDFLRCMDELIIGLFAQYNDESSIVKQTSQRDSSVYRENSYRFPYGNAILNLFNNVVPSDYKDFSLDSIIGNYQLNTQNNHLNQFRGIGTNVFNALSSISRNDDLKCVPRMLCEVASGNRPGEYKRAIGNNEEYLVTGRNAFTQWLGGLAEMSPILIFALAAVLGYSSNGNPTMCYRTFPRCPRNPDKLVHYLNNHNGGFFQFFNGYGGTVYARSSHALQDNSEFLGERKQKALPPGIAKIGKVKFDIPVSAARQDYGKSFFPRENTLKNSERVIFPDYEELNDRPLKNRISKSLPDLRDSDESEDQDVRVLHFTHEYPDSVSDSAFRFPH